MTIDNINARIKEIIEQDLLLTEVNIKLRQLQAQIDKTLSSIAAHKLQVDAEYQDVIDVQKKNDRLRFLGGLDDRILTKEQEEYILAALKLKDLQTELEASQYQEGILLNKKLALDKAVSELDQLLGKKKFIIKSTAIAKEIQHLEKQETLIKLKEIELQTIKEVQHSYRQGHQKMKTLEGLIADLDTQLYSRKSIKAQELKLQAINGLMQEIQLGFDLMLHCKLEAIKELPFPTQLMINLRSFISNMQSGMVRKNQFESFKLQLNNDLSELDSLEARVENLVRVATNESEQLRKETQEWLIAY